jgi:GNAT superfamily N-acetyltransferase
MMSDDFLDGDVVSNRLQVWHDRLADHRADQFVCIAEEGAELAGFICAFGNEDPTWGSYIENLHVAHARKRTGVGSTLMQQVAAWLATRHPQSGVYLWVMEANGSARRFYERLGAANAGTEDKLDPAGGSAPNCRYVWSNPAQLADAR